MATERRYFLVRGRSFRVFCTERKTGWVGRMRSDSAEQPDIALDEGSISHRHAQWRITARGRLEVRNAGSRNGSTIDGQTLTDQWTHLPIGSTIDFGRTGRAWTISDRPARGTTEGLTDERRLLGLDMDSWAREVRATVRGRTLGSFNGRTADVAMELARQYLADLDTVDSSEAGWLSRPLLLARISGDSTEDYFLKRSKVANWLADLKAALTRLDSSLPALLDTSPPSRDPARQGRGQVRLRPPPGGFVFVTPD